MKHLPIFLMALVATLFVACAQPSSQTHPQEEVVAATIPQSDAAVLILLAHPNLAQSHMNAALAQAAAEVEGVQVVNIYDYPVDVNLYRDAVAKAKVLVYEFPFYWMSSPHLLKQWTDEVFTQLVQEGLIEGKKLMVVTTTGSEGAAYQHGARNLYTIEEYLRPFEGQANHAKMLWQAPLVVHGNPQDAAAAEADLQKGCEAYQNRLRDLLR